MLTAVAWLVSLVATIVLDPVATTGVRRALIRLAVVAVTLLVAWCVTRVLVRPLQRLFPDEPGPSRADFAGPTRTLRTERADPGAGQTEVASQDGTGESCRTVPCDTALDLAGHAA
ncbi:hypothetical protein ACFY12_10420 [Streptomyces sp. NPDC001339]|uniref:hypothetical protein n=1 Tax=Streptomyces sp. NPDC001339 TaxID=3364563 RepID=UPI0036D0C0CC